MQHACVFISSHLCDEGEGFRQEAEKGTGKKRFYGMPRERHFVHDGCIMHV